MAARRLCPLRRPGSARLARDPADGAEKQELIPRSFITAAYLLVGLFVGLTGGTQVAVTQGVLAFGDALVVEQEMLVRLPADQADEQWSDEVALEVIEAIEEEVAKLTGGGGVAYITGHILLGDLFEPHRIRRSFAARWSSW